MFLITAQLLNLQCFVSRFNLMFHNTQVQYKSFTSPNCLLRVVLRYYDNFPTFEPGSKLLVLGMVIPPVIGNPYNGYINPYYWVDDHPLSYGNNGS